MSACPYKTEGLPEVRAGASQTVITPPLGVSLAGYFHDRVATSVRDDLFCRAVVIEHRGSRIALVSCDLISVGDDVVSAAKALIEQRTGLAPANVLVCATHTHTGPETRRGRVVSPNEEWLSALPGKIAATVVAATEDMFDALLFPGRRQETRMGSNRLGRQRDGSEVFGKSDVIGAAGAIDPELLALSIREFDGTVRCMVANYAMHPDVIGGGSADFISADWPGEVGHAIADFYGQQAVTVFLNGTCGDINHCLWEQTRLPTRGPAKSVQMGRALAGLAINATETAEPLESAETGAALRVLNIPYYTREASAIEEAKQLLQNPEASASQLYTAKATEQWPFDGQTAEVPLQALRVGDLFVAGMPGEIFVDWGLQVKHWSPGTFTMVAELANDWFGYVPTTDQAHRGAYGAKPILSRRLCADAGRQMVDAIQVMMWELRD